MSQVSYVHNFTLQVLIVTGGRFPGTKFMDSSELLVYGGYSWIEIESLKLPVYVRGAFLINIKNYVFLTG